MAADQSRSLVDVVDLFLLAEGCIRLVLAVVRRGPVGSLLGLPFQSLYLKWTEAPRR